MTTTILLADDHALVRDGLRALLESGHDLHVVGVAGNGRDAVAQAQRRRPDVVVMDMGMPEIDGVEATRRILEKSPDTRVLILSMYSSSEHIHRALQAGARGYVLKESAGQEVIEAIRALLAGRRYLSHRITDVIVDDYIREGVAISPLDRALTGLPNRTLLADRTAQALAHARRFGKSAALLVINLDLFKRINESSGHAAGDKLLRMVAERVQSAVRDGDTVARLGSDTFAVQAANLARPDDVAPIVRKIQSAMHPAFALGGRESSQTL